MAPDSVTAGMRIGEVCRRVGIKPDRLRGWERRYGLTSPERSPAGYRLYSAADEARIRQVHNLIARGFAPAEAARLAMAEPAPRLRGVDGQAPALRADLDASLRRLDGAAADDVLDRVFAAEEIDVALRDVVLPLLRAVGDRWAAGAATVAEEHFTSQILAARLQGMTVRWGRGVGPLALLGCPPGERHDLGLLCFGLAMRSRGWRIAYLGADVPVPDLLAAASELDPDIVILAATTTGPLQASAASLSTVSARARLAVGGAGASPELALRSGAWLLRADVVSAADDVSSAIAA
jgi:MerR family transcriptional regulator, light-induced transcriptional regulator